jgi:hypothetical protein
VIELHVDFWREDRQLKHFWRNFADAVHAVFPQMVRPASFAAMKDV